MLFEKHQVSPAILSILTDGDMGEDDMDSIVTSVADINTRHEDELWFAIGTVPNTVEVIGCPSESGLLKLAYEMRVFLTTSPSITIKAIVQDPKNLPFEVPTTKSVIILFGDHTIQIFHSMYNATKFIEETLVKYDQSEITDFAVLIGEETEFNDKEWDEIIMNGGAQNGV